MLAPTQVWMLANYLLTTREAKRIFGLVGAGGITGWIFSGLLASALARTRGSGTESLLLVMAVILLGCAGLVLVLWREKEKSPAAGATVHAGEAEPKSLRESLAVVFSSPYLIAIASLITLSSIATSFAGWQFKAIAKSAYPNTNALTAFFGQFNFWAGLACLALQLLLTSRFLRRFGLGPALLVVPLALFGGELAVLALGTLGAAILLKGSDQVLRYSVDKSSVELLYLPVPAEIKLQAKSSIDTVIWRLGDGLAGLTLAVFTDRLHWSAQRVSIVNLVFIVGVDLGGGPGAAPLPGHAPAEHPPEAARRRAAVRSGSRPLDRRPPGEAADLLRPRGGALRAGSLRRLAGTADASRRCATCSATRTRRCGGARSSSWTPPAISGRCRASRRCCAMPTSACVRRPSSSSLTMRPPIR